MKPNITFGIIGGYGATGVVVATELRKSTDGGILVGGRRVEKAKALASQFVAEFHRRTLMFSMHVLSMISATGAGSLSTVPDLWWCCRIALRRRLSEAGLTMWTSLA
jgi:glutamyl-tRNA reductase